MLLLRIKLVLFFLLFIFGCSIPNQELIEDLKEFSILDSKAKSKLSNEFEADQPSCIAILPLNFNASYSSNINDVDIKNLLRKTLYAHIAPLKYKDIELDKIDYYFEKNNDLNKISEKIGCDYFLTGQILKFEKQDLTVYSKISMELSIEIQKKSSFTSIWQSQHKVNTHGGSVALSPIGLAIGIIDAAKNLEEEQYVKVADELVREIISTLPDNEQVLYASSFEDSEEYFEENQIKISLNENKEKDKSNLLPNNVNAQLLYDDLKYDQSYEMVNLIINNHEADDKTFFLKGRLEMKFNMLSQSEKSFIKAAALNNKDPMTMNALAYVYSINNKLLKAEAAYRMSIETNSDSIFAHKNLGVLLIKLDRTKDSLYHLDKAAFIALNKGEYQEYKMIIGVIQSLKMNIIDVESSLKSLKNIEKNLIKEI